MGVAVRFAIPAMITQWLLIVHFLVHTKFLDELSRDLVTY